MPTQGKPYDLRGAYVDRFPLPAAKSGQVKDKLFVAAPGSVTYATQRLPVAPRRMRATVSFVDTGKAGPGSSAALLVSSDDNLITDMPMHVIVNRSVARFERRVAGREFELLGAIEHLNIANGREVKIEAVVAPDGNWQLTVNGGIASGHGADYSRMTGLCAWEIYQPGVTGDTVSFHMASAWGS